jgi:predicted deacylase
VPGSDGDLNRAFPGDPRGTGAERLAAAVWRDLEQRRPDAVVDLHADSPMAVPYAIVDRAITPLAVQRAELEARLAAMAEATGLTVLWEYPDERYQRYRLDRSLAGAVVNALAVPAVTVESGPRRRVDPEAVEAAALAARSVLAWAGCVAPRPWVHPTRVEGRWERSASLRVRHAGLFVPDLAAGRVFRAGERLGRVWSVDGRVVEEVAATHRGLVISWVDGAWVEPGGIVGTLGIASA